MQCVLGVRLRYAQDVRYKQPDTNGRDMFGFERTLLAGDATFVLGWMQGADDGKVWGWFHGGSSDPPQATPSSVR